jgi:crotonobetainyl-CoA:carnitine CoA-transferase CaiB-like acyl-CoA transferase
VFSARDRAFSIAVGSEKLWSAFCAAIGRPDLEKLPEFATNARRVENRHALEGTLAAVFRERAMAEWIDRLGAAGIPCSSVRTFAEVAEDPQAALREMFPSIDCPQAGRRRVTGTPVKLSANPGHAGPPAPELGQHTRLALSKLLGLGPVVLDELEQAGVIFAAAAG